MGAALSPQRGERSNSNASEGSVDESSSAAQGGAGKQQATLLPKARKVVYDKDSRTPFTDEKGTVHLYSKKSSVQTDLRLAGDDLQVTSPGPKDAWDFDSPWKPPSDHSDPVERATRVAGLTDKKAIEQRRRNRARRWERRAKEEEEAIRRNREKQEREAKKAALKGALERAGSGKQGSFLVAFT